MRIVASTALAVLLLSLSPLWAQEDRPHAGMLRYPDVGPSHIVFVYAEDLWVVPREGGVATPLASPPGTETWPKFSPDGSEIGFVGNYDGNRDIYTIAMGGGIPHRVTHHPGGETLNDWTAAHGLVFYARRSSGVRSLAELYTVGPRSGMPKKLPVPYGTFASLDAAGKNIAYVPNSRDARTWKRYRGGMATDLWTFNLETLDSERITDWEGTDSLPMWHGDKVYYLSDAGPAHRLNIFAFDTRTKTREQVTRFKDFDVKWPSLGPGPKGGGEIVFQLGSGLHLLDLATGKTREVKIRVPGARPTLRRRAVDVSRSIAAADISPSGKRVTVEARGDIWTLPAENGIPRNLTRTSGVAERMPSWSPDGRWIAYFTDASGEYELVVTQSDGKGETKTLTTNGDCFRYDPVWSPDSEKILFSDKRGGLHLHDLEAGTTKEIMRYRGFGQLPTPSWSHDGRYVAYVQEETDGNHQSIHLYDTKADAHRRLTSPMFSDSEPTFDRKGEYLYYVSSRYFTPRYSSVDSTTFIYTDNEVILAVPLTKDATSPFAAKSDEESFREEKKEDEAEDETKEEEPKPKDGDRGIDGTWTGRAFATGLPLEGAPVTVILKQTSATKVEFSFQTEDSSGSTEADFDPTTGVITGTLVDDEDYEFEIKATVKGDFLEGSATNATIGVLDFTLKRLAANEDETQDEKPATTEAKPSAKDEAKDLYFDDFERRAMRLPIRNGLFSNLAVNQGGALLFVRRGGRGSGVSAEIKIFDLGAKKQQEKKVTNGRGFIMSADGKKILIASGRGGSIMDARASASGKSIVTRGMTAHIAPREEWAQIFHETWRLFRDYFYVGNMHGVDWEGVRDAYRPMVDDCTTRNDLSYIIREVISELNVGHAYYRSGGGSGGAPSVSVGMLGVDFEIANGAYRIASILEGAPWDDDARGPLSQPGVDVKVGDYLLAVNGQPLDMSQDPWAAFQGMAGIVTTLTVSDSPTLDDKAREVMVKPLSNESGLRYRAWIEKNRAHVEAASKGQIGYIYVPNTGIEGQNELVRQYFGQLDKAALLIDERWNGGGQIPTRFIEMLNRPVTNYWATRDSTDWTWPPHGHRGPKAMLINGLAGSGGDAFPAYFRQAGLGKLIGTRTWGGLVGISGNPSFIDGTALSIPTFGFYESDGTWGIEGHGVDPDMEVIDDPSQLARGVDPQLEAAIKHLLEEIQKRPFRRPTRPQAPNRKGMGIAEGDK